MNQRLVIRMASLLLTVALVGCDDKLDPYSSADRGLEVTPLTFALEFGQTREVSATIDGQPAPVTWESSNSNIIQVTQTGPSTATVTPIGVGTAAVTATLASGGILRSSSVTVLPSFTILRVTGLASSAPRGSEEEFEVNVPAGLTNLTVTLRSAAGQGDVDLYLIDPDGVLRCASEAGGNNETCSRNNPIAGTWTIILGLWDPYFGVTLEVRGTRP